VPRHTGACTLKKRVLKNFLASRARCLSMMLRVGAQGGCWDRGQGTRRQRSNSWWEKCTTQCPLPVTAGMKSPSDTSSYPPCPLVLIAARFSASRWPLRVSLPSPAAPPARALSCAMRSR